MNLIKKLFKPRTDFKTLIAQGALILDVRTSGEYKSGHIRGSINIPLDMLDRDLAKIQKQNRTIITCCASGMRSAVAANKLKSKGLEAFNGGSWQAVNMLV